MSDVAGWSPIAAENDSPSPNGFPEGMPPSGVNNAAREVMAAVKRAFDTLDASGTVYNATRLNSQLAAFYLNRANHTGANNADTLQNFNGSYYLDRNNHTGTNNASQLNGQAASYYLDLVNAIGTLARARNNILYGSVDSAGTVLNVPSGFTTSRTSTGKYRITHNFGTTNYTIVSLVVFDTGASDPWIINAVSKNTNFFDIVIGDESVTLVDRNFEFSVGLW